VIRPQGHAGSAHALRRSRPISELSRDGRTAADSPYLAIVLGIVVTVIIGFWPSYFGPLSRGGADKHWIIHVHAAVFIGWLVLLVTQALLVSMGKGRLHRRVGQVGLVYGTLLFCVGLVISVAAPALAVKAGRLPVERAGLIVLYNLTDILVFGAFFAAAAAYRRQREWHSRLILSATIALTGAAVGRVIPSGSLWYLIVWLAPLAASMAMDLATVKRLHGVSLLSVAVFVGVFFKVAFYSASPVWRVFGKMLIDPFV